MKPLEELIEEKRIEQQKKVEAENKRNTEKDEKMAWFERKQKHVDNLNEDDIKRILKEKEEARIQREKDARETLLAVEKRDREYWDSIVKDCLDGDPETRFAKFLVRASMKGLFTLNPMQQPQDKMRVFTDLLRFHGIALKDSKEKPSRDDFEMTTLFVADPFIKKSDVVLTRRSMFPMEDKTVKVEGQ